MWLNFFNLSTFDNLKWKFLITFPGRLWVIFSGRFRFIWRSGIFVPPHAAALECREKKPALLFEYVPNFFVKRRGIQILFFATAVESSHRDGFIRRQCRRGRSRLVKAASPLPKSQSSSSPDKRQQKVEATSRHLGRGGGDGCLSDLGHFQYCVSQVGLVPY